MNVEEAMHGGDVQLREVVRVKDPGVIDQYVDAAKRVDRVLDDGLRAGRIGDVRAVRLGDAPGRSDRGHNVLGRSAVHAYSICPNTKVIDDHSRATRRKQLGVTASDS